MEGYLLDILDEIGEKSEFSLLIKALYLNCPGNVIRKIITYLEFYSKNKDNPKSSKVLIGKKEELLALVKIYDY